VINKKRPEISALISLLFNLHENDSRFLQKKDIISDALPFPVRILVCAEKITLKKYIGVSLDIILQKRYEKVSLTLFFQSAHFFTNKIRLFSKSEESRSNY